MKREEESEGVIQEEQVKVDGRGVLRRWYMDEQKDRFQKSQRLMMNHDGGSNGVSRKTRRLRGLHQISPPQMFS